MGNLKRLAQVLCKKYSDQLEERKGKLAEAQEKHQGGKLQMRKADLEDLSLRLRRGAELDENLIEYYKKIVLGPIDDGVRMKDQELRVLGQEIVDLECEISCLERAVDILSKV